MDSPKASIFEAHLALQAGTIDEAIAAATAVSDYPDLATEERFADVATVACYLRGTAHEKAAAPGDARADYERALARATLHAGARDGLARLA